MTEPQTNTDGPELVVYEDYFGFGEQQVYTLPDGKQTITFKIMNEGQRKEFQKKTNRDLTINRASGDAKVKMDPAEERHVLITTSVTGWTLMRNKGTREQPVWEPAPFSSGSPGAELEKWLQNANPKIVDQLELAIRKANPWLQQDMTIEAIDEQIANLQEMREAKLQEEKEKGNSSSR